MIDQIKKCKKVKKIYVLIPDTISNKKIEIFLKKKKINFFKEMKIMFLIDFITF